MPADTAVSSPAPLTVATDGLPLDQLPLPTVSDSTSVPPGQRAEPEVIVPASAAGFTVTGNVAEVVPQLLVTV